MTRRVTILLFGLMALAMTGTGCSSWRYRGFVNETTRVTAVESKQKYRLQSVTFEPYVNQMAVAGDNVVSQWISTRAYVPYYNQLKEFDTRNDSSYVRDITDAAKGFCTTALDAETVDVRLVPHPEEKRGFLSFLFPFAITAGIVPSNKSRDIPFDIKVIFGGDNKSVRSSAAVVRIDSRFAFSPLGSSIYAKTAGAEACETMAGYLIFDSRNDLLRAAFVQTVASAVKRAIAERENLDMSKRGDIELERDEEKPAFRPQEPDPVFPDSELPKPETKTNENAQDEFFDS